MKQIASQEQLARLEKYFQKSLLKYDYKYEYKCTLKYKPTFC